jgi:CubicO group peptidase (beta-lactamase class C family)
MQSRVRQFLGACLASALLASGAPSMAQDLPVASTHAGGVSNERLRRLDAFMEQAIAEKRVPGAVVLIARHGHVAHHKAYGMIDGKSSRTMRTDDIFRIYSMTKPIASIALLMLYEEGKFQLDDPLELYIPEFRDLKVLAGTDTQGNMILEEPKRKPTIHDAFRHTLGIGAGGGPTPVDQLYVEKRIAINRLESLSEQMKLLGEVPLLYQPGDRWVYGFGHDVQAYLVEHFSGMPFDRFLQQRLFGPLKMHDTGFTVGRDKPERVAGLEDVPESLPANNPAIDMRASTYDRFATRPMGTLGLWSTAMDYARLSQMLLNKGELDGTRILGKKTVELMAQNHLPEVIGTLAEFGGMPGVGYGLGVSVVVDPAAAGNLSSAGAFGWTGAATTRFIIDPEEDLVAIIMAQKWPYDSRLLSEFQTLVYQALVTESGHQ